MKQYYTPFKRARYFYDRFIKQWTLNLIDKNGDDLLEDLDGNNIESSYFWNKSQLEQYVKNNKL